MNKLGFYIFIWYALTASFNVFNKLLLNSLNLPFMVTAMQLVIGSVMILPSFLYKQQTQNKKMLLRCSQLQFRFMIWWRRFSKIALMHGLGSTALVYSISTGDVSFTHVVKASEPLFACALSIFLLGTNFSKQTLLSLVIIVFGVTLSAVVDASFGWPTFISAIISNFCNQTRIVLAKQDLNNNNETIDGITINVNTDANVDLEKNQEIDNGNGNGDGDGDGNGSGNDCEKEKFLQGIESKISTPVSAPTMFRIITILATIQMVPIALLIEGSSMFQVWSECDTDTHTLLVYLFFSGFCHYAYNECAFWVLDIVTPTTHAVTNVFKRVVIIVISILVLNSPVSVLSAIGVLTAVVGTLLYSLLPKT
jgi:solute carrier family 35, member E1